MKVSESKILNDIPLVRQRVWTEDPLPFKGQLGVGPEPKG